jgi:mannose-6-phosphate isomerase-like protein (cupin superfamily)
MTHEDDRRTLTSVAYQNGEIKIIIAKKDCRLGDHYHKVKTEIFQLLKGDGVGVINSHSFNLLTGNHYLVNPNESHSFSLKKDSVLVCICSHPYDKNDDYEAT